MERRILTVQNLYDYLLSQNQNLNFTSLDAGYELAVSSHGIFEVQEYKDDEGLIYCNLKAFHDLSNANQSYIDKNVFKKRAHTMRDRPIMADIIDVDDGKGNIIKDFSGHTAHYDKENEKMVYIEIPVGHVVNPENIRVEYDEEYQRDFAIADCVIYEEYTDACDILRRREKVDCSVELVIRELSFDSSSKELRLDDYYVQGITLLGESVQPGMKGSNVTLKDFSAENNSLIFNAQLVNSIADAVAKRLSDKADMSAQFLEKGGRDQVKFDELLKKYGRTIDDIDFEYENLTDEELEEAFAKAFDEEDPSVSDPEENPEDFEENKEGNKDSEDFAEENDNEQDDDSLLDKKITHSVTYGGITKDFSVSLQDKIYALSTLVNDTYSESDNAWYDVTVYDDEKYVVMKDWWNDKAFKQSYKVKKDVYSLVGDRVAVYAQYLTDDEIKKLDEMRTNYSSIAEKLAKYESEPAKMEILNSDEYAKIADTVEFAYLKKEENHFDLSVEEVREKADSLLLAYAKTGKLDFAVNDKKVGMKKFGNKASNKNGRYGKLFKN